MPPPVSEQVVVITGASSGIGYCTARHLASRGGRVVLTARSEDALETVEREIRRDGGEALAVPGDVTSEEDMEEVVRRALERHGRIDTWVNCAAVFIQGRVQDISLEEYRRVLDVNLAGTINGTLRALRPMLERDSGVIIQVSSIVGRRGAPYTGPYAAAKRGIEGFSEAARSELWGTGVRISTLYLPAVDTPIYQHARAKMGTMPKPPPPVADPGRVARAIADLAESGEPHRHFGLFHYLYVAPDEVSPAVGDWFLHHTAGFTRSSWMAGPDNLDRPTGGPPRARGGWADRGWKGATLGEVARVLPVETALAAAGLLGAAALLWRRARG